MDITIGFSKPKTWKPFAWLIMVGYGIPFDHVYVKIDFPKIGTTAIYQASGTMVNFMAQDVFFANNVTLHEFVIPLDDNSRANLMKFCIDNAGKPYGIKECFGLAWVRLNALVGRKIANPFKADGSTYVCSELAAYILNNFTKTNISGDLADATPLEVYNTLLAGSNGTPN